MSSSALRKPRIPSTRGVSPNPASPPPAPHAPSTMQSSAYATGGLPAVPASQKAQNETYFASMGSANNSRPADLPPSEGGRYSGFGSGGDSSFNPSSATSSRALPTYDDLREDPAGALGRGWNLFSSALGSAGRAVNESVFSSRVGNVQPIVEPDIDDCELADPSYNPLSNEQSIRPCSRRSPRTSQPPEKRSRPPPVEEEKLSHRVCNRREKSSDEIWATTSEISEPERWSD